MKIRENWLDIAKGLVIILVVLGHAMPNTEINASRFVSWFHMPAFFILIGYLFKPVNSFQELRKTLIKRSKQLLIPYVSFLILITIIRFFLLSFEQDFTLNFIIKNIIVLIIGGRYLEGLYGVFWFVTCLFASYIILWILFLLIKSFRLQLIAVAVLYLLAHLEAALAINYTIHIPWNIDVALLASTYMAIGYWSKKYLSQMHWMYTILFSIVSIALITSTYLGVFDFYLAMKGLHYNHLVLDLFIPLTMSFAVCGISHLLDKLKIGNIFAEIGIYSLPIMYLHIPLNYYFDDYYGATVFVLIGVLLPWMVSKYFFEKHGSTRLLFLGKTETKFQ